MGLDLGTSKVVVIVGEADEYGQVNLVGVGEAPSEGLRKGVVVNIEKTVDSIHAAVVRAERMAGVKLDAAVVSLAGPHLGCQLSRGVIAVSRADREIAAGDVNRVIEASRAISVDRAAGATSPPATASPLRANSSRAAAPRGPTYCARLSVSAISRIARSRRAGLIAVHETSAARRSWARCADAHSGSRRATRARSSSVGTPSNSLASAARRAGSGGGSAKRGSASARR